MLQKNLPNQKIFCYKHSRSFLGVPFIFLHFLTSDYVDGINLTNFGVIYVTSSEKAGVRFLINVVDICPIFFYDKATSLFFRIICQILSVNRNDKKFRTSNIGVELYLGNTYNGTSFLYEKDFKCC